MQDSTVVENVDLSLENILTKILNKISSLKSYAFDANREGIAHHQSARLNEAEECYRQALAIKPDFPEALNNLGIVLRARGRLEESARSYRSALTLRPNYAQAYNNLGNVLREMNRLEEAKASYCAAIRVMPDYADAFCNLGDTLSAQFRTVEAQANYRRALELKPGLSSALVALCDLLENSNNIDELRVLLDEIDDAQYISSPGLALVKAKLLRRENNFYDAIFVLLKVKPESVTEPFLASEIFATLGDLYDRVGSPEKAYECFVLGKKIAATNFSRHGANKETYLKKIISEIESFKAQKNAILNVSYFKPIKLVFLVGFPRSGTTLLDSILRSHPSVDVIEEKPMLSLVLIKISQYEKENPDYLQQIDVGQLAELRQIYLDELEKYRDTTRLEALVIDKMPLNIAHADIIHCVFPEAKFILALRDPRDCVLSCFMQNFMPNDAMANFLSVDDAANLYCTVMKIWACYEIALSLASHRVRYEDIVTDFSTTVQCLLDFLGLTWDDALSQFQSTALNRAQIRTPSYHQVVQPIYQRASGRWIRYKKQIGHVFPVLQPWIKVFGYETSENEIT